MSAQAQQLRDKLFVHEWEVKNWTNVVQNEELIRNTKTEVKCVPKKIVYAKFVVGLKVYWGQQSDTGVIGFYCEQIKKHYCLENAQINLVVGVLNNTGTEALAYESSAMSETGTTVETGSSFWDFGSITQATNWMNTEGSMIFKLKLTLQIFPEDISYSKTNEFRKTSTDNLCQNFAKLLDNSLCSDLKIITKENTEHFAHKTILCTQCPVFTSMFRSEFLESSNGRKEGWIFILEG